MSLGTLNVTLVLDSSQFNAGVAQGTKSIIRLKAQLDQADSSSRKAQTGINSLGRTLRDTVITIGLARNAILNLWTAFGQAPSAMVATTAEFERMQTLLTNMSTATGMDAKLADSREQFDQILDLARSAPFEIRDITDAWVKYKSAGIDPANGSIKALIDGVSQFGGTSETMKRAAIAIQQMAGKGVISMEELRQQLGEAIPSATNKMADAMGISTGKLTKLVSTGTVEASDALRRMFAEFERSFGGASEAMMETFTGILSVMKTEMQVFSKTVVEDSGLFDALKQAMSEFTEALKGPELQQAGIQLGAILANIVRNFAEAVKILWEYRKAVIAVAAAVAAAITWFKVIVPTFTAITAASTVLVAAFKSVALWTWYLSATLRTAGIAAMLAEIRIAITALFAASGPVGWAVIIVGALASAALAFRLFKKDIGEASEELSRFWENATPEQISAAKKEIEDYRSRIASIRRELEYFQERAAGGDTTVESAIAELTASLARYNGKLVEAEALLRKAENAYGRSQENRWSRIFEQDVKNLAQAFSVRARDEEALLKQDIEKRAKNDEEAAKLFAKERQAIREREYNQIIKLYDFNLAKQQAALLKSNNESQKRVIDANIGILEGLKKQLTANYEQFIRDMNSGVVLTSTPGNGEAKDPLEQFLEQQRIKAERYKAVIAGEKEALEEVAAFNEEAEALKNGMFNFRGKNYSAAQIDAARRQVQMTAEERNKAEAVGKAARDNSYAFDQLGNVLGSTAEEWRAWESVLQSGGLEIANNSVLSLQKTLGKLRESVLPNERARFDEMAAGIIGDRANIAFAQQFVSLQKQRRDNEVSLMMTQGQRHQAQMDAFVQEQEQYIKQNGLTDENAAKIRDATNAIVEQKNQLYALQSPLGQLAAEWMDVTAQMQQATANWVNQGTDMLVDFLETGKFAFGDFAKSILKDILKIIIRALIAQAILAAIGITPGVSTGSGFMDMIGNSLGAGIPVTKNAKGGVMSGDGSMPLRRYAEGGIAKRPQLAMFGEGSLPEAYVPLPDGRSIPVTMTNPMSGQSPDVTVNVINQSGQQVSAEQRGAPRFDGNGYVLDVVLKAVSTPGSFRDAMRTAVR